MLGYNPAGLCDTCAPLLPKPFQGQFGTSARLSTGSSCFHRSGASSWHRKPVILWPHSTARPETKNQVYQAYVGVEGRGAEQSD